MHIGLVGLGKMGGNMRERLRRAGHTVVGYDRNPDLSDVDSLEELVERCPCPEGRLGDGPGRRPDPRDDQGARRAARRGRPRRRRRQLPLDRRPAPTPSCSPSKGIGFVDCGVSGGVWGLENGYALMCGGADDDVAKVQPAFDALKPEGDFGFVHAGKVGAGHFAKMVHNGIEYAMMQAYAEGWELLAEGRPGRQRHRGLRLLARGHRDPLLAARPAGRRARGRRRPRPDPPATPRTPARAAGRSRPRSTTPCRCTSSPPRCSPGSPRARTTSRR